MTIKELKENLVKLIADDWALVSAGTPEDWNTLTVSWGGIGLLMSRIISLSAFLIPNIRICFAFAAEFPAETVTR